MKVLLLICVFIICASSLKAPKLRWEYGGCWITYRPWCDRSWYASPYAGQLDKNGVKEVVGAHYEVFRLKGTNGRGNNGEDDIWNVKSGMDVTGAGTSSGRTWPSVVVADLDKDGQLEIITGHNTGVVSVLKPNGKFKNGWPKTVVSGLEVRSLKAADLDNDGKLEVISGSMQADRNTWVFSHDGKVKWSRTSGDNGENGYNHAVLSDSIGIVDFKRSNKKLDVISPSDTHYVHGYAANGAFISVNQNIYSASAQTHWGNTGVWMKYAIEKQGFGPCGEMRVNYASGSTASGDLNGDGKIEVVVAGSAYPACGSSTGDVEYEAVHIFNRDRSRFKDADYNWRSSTPTKPGKPLVALGSFSTIEDVGPNLVLADLDNNGELEIIFPSWDGKVHAYWLNQKERFNWPYTVGTKSDPRYAAEPVVADLDNDGKAEVILCTFPRKGNNRRGHLIILDYKGNELYKKTLPEDPDEDWNGCLAAPTLANIDDNDDLEVVLNTANAGHVAYRLPETKNAKILWGTGRGNFKRTGQAKKLKCGRKLRLKVNKISNLTKRKDECKAIKCRWNASQNKCLERKLY